MKRLIDRCLVAVSFLFSCAPVLATVTGWVAVKTALYEQTADNVQPTQALECNFYIHVEGDADSITLTGPGLGSGLNMTEVGPDDWELSVDFASKAQLDAAFPAGSTFTLTASGGTGGTKVQNFTIPSDGYPATPYLTGAIFSGLQSLNVYQDYPMSWNSYSGGPEILTIFPAAGGFWVVEEDVDDAYILPAGALDDQSDYMGHLEFFAVSPLPLTDFGGGAFRFISLTKFGIHSEVPTVFLGDDFNNNSMDTGKWQVTDSAGSASFSETNQQLEFNSAATADEFIEWTWQGLSPSYEEGWSVEIDFLALYLPQQPSESHFFGLSLQGNGYAFDLHYASYVHGTFLETDIYDLDGPDIADNQSLVAAGPVTLKISFDASTKLLQSAYSAGGGFIPLSTYSAAAFDMTDSSNFTIKLQGESVNMAMNQDDAVFDNFEVTQSDAAIETKELNDDFSDNSRNTDLWEVFRVSAEREWVEQNGRLEAISTAGVYERDAGVWEWTGPRPACDENWTVTFDATINFTGTTPGSSIWIGFLAADSTLSNTATVEQWVQDGERGVDAGVKVNGADLREVNELISSNTVTLRMNYDSGKKELHASYDDGSGYWNYLASLSVADWEMTDADDFRILIFGGSEEDGLASGDAYGDNFSFAINNIESDPETAIPCQSIVGSWYMKEKNVPSHDNVALTFLTNGVYFMCQDGDSVYDPNGWDGMERGTYTWDPVTGAFSITAVHEDTNNEWGLSGSLFDEGMYVSIRNNSFRWSEIDVGPAHLYRVVAQKTSPSIVGSWLIDGVAAVTFLDNGIYYLAHAHIPGGGGQAGMERGTYTWDPVMGDFNPMPIVDTNGEWGLSHGHENDTITIDGNTLYLTVEGEGTYPGYRIVDAACSDIDSDGLPDAFEIQISGSPTGAVPEGNSDSDDLTDREEFIAGTDAGNGSSVFVVSNAPPSPAGHVLTWYAIPGRVYTVEWTDHLTNSFQTLETGITHPQNSYTDTVHNAESGGFYNLKVELAD